MPLSHSFCFTYYFQKLVFRMDPRLSFVVLSKAGAELKVDLRKLFCFAVTQEGRCVM